jgi:hypothetical protein
MNAGRVIGIGLMAMALAACSSHGDKSLPMQLANALDLRPPPPVIRQPVLPEMLKACRGHVLVPALGMKFVARGASPPDSGQYLREENISAPYRIISPGVRLTQDQSPTRLNVELDRWDRIVGLFCG